MDETADCIMEIVETARAQAKKAEKNFDFSSKQIQASARSSRNLFSSDTFRDVADIAANSKKACDELYGTYQMLVRFLDDGCRPLLNQNPGGKYIGEVAKLIKWLNEESNIQNNFTSSLNGRSLSGGISAQYFPSIENIMIEKYWKTIYEMTPEAKEERERAIEEARCKKIEDLKREEQEKRDYVAYKEKQARYAAAILKKYEEIHKQWEIRCKKVVEEFTIKYKKELQDYEKINRVRAENIKEEQSTRIKLKIDEKKQELCRLTQGASDTSPFNLSKKRRLNLECRRLQQSLMEAESDLDSVENQYKNTLYEIAAELSKTKSQMSKSFREAQYLPPEPVKPQEKCYETWEHNFIEWNNKFYRQEIKEVLLDFPEKNMLPEMMQEESPVLKKLPGYRIEEIEYYMEIDGILQGEVIEGHRYYKVL